MCDEFFVTDVMSLGGETIHRRKPTRQVGMRALFLQYLPLFCPVPQLREVPVLNIKKNKRNLNYFACFLFNFFFCFFYENKQI